MPVPSIFQKSVHGSYALDIQTSADVRYLDVYKVWVLVNQIKTTCLYLRAFSYWQSRPPEEREKLAPNWMNEDEPFLGFFRNRSPKQGPLNVWWCMYVCFFFPTCTPLKLYSNNVGYLFVVGYLKIQTDSAIGFFTSFHHHFVNMFCFLPNRT